MIKNILFPVDFTPSCIGMAAYVKGVAATFGSRVTLLHVCDLTSHNGFELYIRTLQEIAEEHWCVAKDKLDCFLADEFPLAQCPRILRSGEAAAEIAEIATGRFDLIVMPTNAGPFRQTLLGSTTGKVLNDADCPVLTSEHADITIPKVLEPRQWVCGIGVGPDSERVLRFALRAAAHARANLKVIHAMDDSDSSPSRLGFHPAQNALDSLEVLIGQKIRVVKGPPKEALIEAVQQSCADVLIIGRAPERGVLGRMRDLTYSLIRDSPVPVLSV